MDGRLAQQPARAGALGNVLLLAGLVLRVLERRARQGTPLSTPPRSAWARATGQEMPYHLPPLSVTPGFPDTAVLHPRDPCRPVAVILAAAGFTDRIYTQMPLRSATDMPWR